ncbi:MAG: DUF2975 domain-containing protein [Bacteroidales bacterium]|nr:DUF2975 domain-containing protein [Bacteroidales bacterium]MBK7626058.1 DUF2975 domain-containing protein [Bacteroidales bacterium]
MTKRNNLVFIGLQIIGWIIFVGLCIEAGALIVNFVLSLFNPEVVHNLYQKLDLSQIYNTNIWVYFGMYGFILTISISKAYLFYVVIMLLHKLDLEKPFNTYVADQFKKISYITLEIGIISLIAREISQSMVHYGLEPGTLDKFWEDGSAFLLMAAVVYVLATIFSRGVEIQNENDLTV